MFTKTKTKKTSWYVLGLFILIGTIVNAQDRKVSGKIISSDDAMGLPGANVLIKGTAKGISTDMDGSYSITVSDKKTVLVFNYVGYKTKEVVVGDKNTINVTLDPDVSSLEEVVVVGYGTRKKSDITGSVSTVKASELSAFPVLSGEQALQGRAAGVAVQSNNGGEPGAPIKIRVRGGTSINASGDALIVVDGFVGGAMPAPEDIASMDVLKDASATAIYGSRGSNGVILVTTKKGKVGKTQVEFSNSTSFQQVNNKLDLLNAQQYNDYYYIVNNQKLLQNPVPATPALTSPSAPVATTDTNWQDQIFKSGMISNSQLSISGGSDKIKYYMSANYFNQEGVVINNNLERFTILSNIDAEVTSKLKVGLNLFRSRLSNSGIISQTNTSGSGAAGVISSAYKFNPNNGILNPDGTFTTNTLPDQLDNPFATATENVNDRVSNNNRINFSANYQIIPSLEFKTTLGYSNDDSKVGTYQPSTVIAGAGVGGLATITNRSSSTFLSENYLTYSKNIAKGKLILLGGYSYQKDIAEFNIARSQRFSSNVLSYNNLSAGSEFLASDSNKEVRELISSYGRLNYDYDDKYLFTFTGRYDGSSAFSKNNKYAFFPSGAIGWNISKENFFKDIEAVSNLKLRYSYGLTGNPGISPYSTLARYSPVFSNVGDTSVSAVVPTGFANNELKWETTYQSNLGLDLGLFNSKLNLSVDYYITTTKDLLFERPLPLYSGGASRLENIGELQNRGLEFTLNTKNVNKENFSWSTDFNIAFNKNKILKLPDNDKDIFYNTLPSSFTGGTSTQVLRAGESLGLFYGYIYDGVLQEDRTYSSTPVAGVESRAGGQNLRDINGDGTITSADLTIIGDPNPDFIGGITNDFKYKNFDLNIFFQGSVGGDILSYTLLELASSGGANLTTEALNAWTPQNTNTNVPSPALRPRGLVTSRFVYDASYIRLKNISLGYSLPNKLCTKIGVNKVRFNVSAQNILTFTNYPGSDPEVNYRNGDDQGSNRNLGLDYGSYPNIKTYTIGINVKF